MTQAPTAPAPAEPVRLLVIGAGDRGTGHARWALDHPDRAKVVGVAEPRRARREALAQAHGIAPHNTVEDWREFAGRKFAARERVADAVLVCTLDREHLAPVEAFAELGYHVMVEKPMALDEESCRAIVTATENAGVMLAVGHVLRYTPYTALVKEIVDSGRLGQVLSVQHLEPVGYWHQAHSYVRGQWRRTDQSTSMLMAKSCHDLDWIQYILGQAPARVSSFGELTHFTSANRPEAATDRCVECPLQSSCPYSATRFYGGMLERGEHHWPLTVVVDECTPEALDEALRTGPYGRCVYACDNDVVDHQVVTMQFPDGATGAFTMTGFTEAANRSTRLFGTHGELIGDGESVVIRDFTTGTEERLNVGDFGAMTAAGAHGGGDAGLMNAFISAIAAKDPTLIKSGPRDSLSSHLTVLAAERARLHGTVEELAHNEP